MVHQALAGDRMIGMVLLKPGYEARIRRARRRCTTSAVPGTITHVERLADGRFNIVLRRHREVPHRPRAPPTDTVLYREAHVAPIAEALDRRRPRAAAAAAHRLETLLAPLFSAHARASRLPEIMSDEDLVNALAQYLALEPVEKQALLEMRRPVGAAAGRCVELLEMKALTEKALDGAGQLH